MSTYYAAVKYPVDATRAQKIRALEEGIEMCALMLVEEFGLSYEDVEDTLAAAMSTAEQAEQWIKDNAATDADGVGQ